jgi:hypothetical protein
MFGGGSVPSRLIFSKRLLAESQVPALTKTSARPAKISASIADRVPRVMFDVIDWSEDQAVLPFEDVGSSPSSQDRSIPLGFSSGSQESAAGGFRPKRS